ncbi:SAV_915 family protein [Streptomyces sp. NPDC002454]
MVEGPRTAVRTRAERATEGVNCAEEPEPPDTGACAGAPSGPGPRDGGRDGAERDGGGAPRALFVPARTGPGGCTARLFRTPLGERTAVGFTSAARLVEVLGPGTAYVRLAVPALRALVAPVGVRRLTVDPVLVARPVGPATGPGPAGGRSVLLSASGGGGAR